MMLKQKLTLREKFLAALLHALPKTFVIDMNEQAQASTMDACFFVILLS